MPCLTKKKKKTAPHLLRRLRQMAQAGPPTRLPVPGCPRQGRRRALQELQAVHRARGAAKGASAAIPGAEQVQR